MKVIYHKRRGIYMKALKKAAAALLAVCLMVPMFSFVVFAADGRLMFSDPETKVGENVSVDLVIQSQGNTIADVSVTMRYETGDLEFVSGDGFEADGSGTLTYSGTGNSSELRATAQFRALTAGETKITVSDYSGSITAGEELNLTEGSSTITIAAADDGTTSVAPSSDTTSDTAGETTDIVVNVNGVDYNFSEAFTSADIPAGYYEATQTFNGEERKFVANDAGVYLGYLVDSSGAGAFFLYNEEDATFAPYVELSISDTTSIIPLAEPEGLKMPEGYQEVNLNLTGLDQQYSAWSNPETDRYYLIYALNTRSGEKGLYQYDTEDGTYQSYTLPQSTEEKPAGSALSGGLSRFIGEHALVLVVAAAAIILLLLILMIIFAVKLVHRNQELDDLYEEYDIPYEDDEPEIEKKSKKKSSLKEEEDEFDEYDDDFDDEYDDEYDDGGYSDDEYEDDEEYDNDDEDDEDGYDDEGYDDDGEYDDYEEESVARGKTKNIKSRKKDSSRTEDEEDYEIDFIDL